MELNTIPTATNTINNIRQTLPSRPTHHKPTQEDIYFEPIPTEETNIPDYQTHINNRLTIPDDLMEGEDPYIHDEEFEYIPEETIRALPHTEWGNMKPILTWIPGSPFIVNKNLHQSALPICLVIAQILCFVYISYLFRCFNWYPSVIVLKISSILLFVFFVKTGFTDPGFVRRRPDPIMLRDYEGPWYCRKDMVTLREKDEKNIRHCIDCGLCVEGYDHHCVVVGNCIGRRNKFSFYAMAVCYVFTVCSAMASLIGALGVDGKNQGSCARLL